MKTLVQLYEGKPIGIKLPVQVTLDRGRGRSGDEGRHGGAVLQERGAGERHEDPGAAFHRRGRARSSSPPKTAPTSGGPSDAPILSPALNVMIAAARKAGRPLIRDFGELENLQISMKGPADFVTTADKRTETDPDRGTVARPGPAMAFWARKAARSRAPTRRHRFIIDPIDGTTNFMHGIPHFAISIGLEREGQLVSGVVFNPVTDDLYHRREGPWRLSQQQAAARRGAQGTGASADRHRPALPGHGRPCPRHAPNWPR